MQYSFAEDGLTFTVFCKCGGLRRKSGGFKLITPVNILKACLYSSEKRLSIRFYNILKHSFSSFVANLIYSLSHYVDSETSSSRNQIFVCDLAWVTIARDSESEQPFYPVGQFKRSLTFFLPIGGQNLRQLFYESVCRFNWGMRLDKSGPSGRLV